MPEEELAPIEVIDWHEVGKKAELKKGEIGEAAAEFAKLFGLLKKSRVALVEIEQGGALAAFTYFFENIAHSGAYVVPILGATTPYDIEEHKEKFGAKSCAWVTSSATEEAWITEKFNIIKPMNLFEITSFIKTISKKTEEQLFYVTDLFDEIYNLITEKEFHTLLSRIHTMLKGSNDTMVIVVQTSLYEKGYLAMLERYADVKVVYGAKIRVVDLRTNKVEHIK